MIKIIAHDRASPPPPPEHPDHPEPPVHPERLAEKLPERFVQSNGEDGRGSAAPTPLRVMPLHYPGDGLHLLAHPGRRTLFLGTPEATGQAFCCHEVRPQTARYHARYSHPHTASDRRGASWFSLGAVLLYADMFVTQFTDHGSLAEVFEETYPTAQSPIPLNPQSLLASFAPHIYPFVPDSRKRSCGLWSDLAVHGLGRLAQTLALAAQERTFRAETGRPTPPTHRRTLIELIRRTSQGACTRGERAGAGITTQFREVS